MNKFIYNLRYWWETHTFLAILITILFWGGIWLILVWSFDYGCHKESNGFYVGCPNTSNNYYQDGSLSPYIEPLEPN